MLYSTDLESGRSWNKGMHCTKTVDEWKPGALQIAIFAKKLPCIHNLAGQPCPSGRGSSQQWKSWCCVTTRCNKDNSCEESLSDVLFTVSEVRSPLQLWLHLLSWHEARPPSDLSLGFVLHVLLIHAGSLVPSKVDGVVLASSTERNLHFAVCPVQFLQCGGGDRSLRVGTFLHRRKGAAAIRKVRNVAAQ